MGKEDLAIIQRDAEGRLGAYFKIKKEEENRQKLLGDRKSNKKSDDDMADLAKEHNALSESSRMLDEVIGQGTGTLSQLIGQNKTLKNARKKLLDAANVIGLSSSLVN